MGAKRLMITLLSCILPCPSFALPTPTNFPTELLLNGQPIDPLCIFEAESFNKAVDLNKCGIQAESDRKIIDSTPEMIKKGIVGYNYLWPIDKNNTTHANAYSYYSVIGNMKDTYIIYALNNTGGSGQFSGIYYVKRDGNNLRVQLLIGGDRCNGGITNVKYKNNKLLFTMNLTSYDLFDLANDDPHQVKAYNGLSACAVCCEGTANYEINPNESIDAAKLINVDLGDEIINPSKASQGDYEYCFDSIVADYQKRGMRNLTLDQVKELVQLFNTKCF